MSLLRRLGASPGVWTGPEAGGEGGEFVQSPSVWTLPLRRNTGQESSSLFENSEEAAEEGELNELQCIK